MKKTMFRLGVIVAAAGIWALAVASRAATFTSTSGATEIRFTLSPGGAKTFTLPAKQSPVRIAVSLTFANGGTQTPTELMEALVNQDPKSSQVTWIGTNSDGSTTAGTTLSGSTIASILPNVTLSVADAATGILKITQNASTTTIAGEYVVKMLF